MVGASGQVVGRDRDYTDHQATQETIRIVGEHDPDIPLFFYVAFQVNSHIGDTVILTENDSNDSKTAV